ncbi:MAG TPA: hypothetical protein VNT55_15030 [Baekduia sp.]|nr:hypothetical protein [Baekduia sp.]
MPFPRFALPLAITIGLAIALPTGAGAAQPASGTGGLRAVAAAEDDDAPVLPSRVANALRRTDNALASAESHLDEGEYSQAVTALRSVKNNMYRADRAARAQMNAAPPADPEGEGDDAVTTGPDSVIAVLGEEHEVVVTLAGLFDTNSKGVVDGLSHTLFRTISARDGLLNAVIALDPEGAGADYADGMADTADQYPDEVANLTETLASDSLSAGGRAVLTPALTRVTATANAFAAAFGGGE